MAKDQGGTQSALAKLVRPETLEDIEEYLRPQFPPKKRNMAPKDGIQTGPRMDMRRRIVMDGHGRWREVTGPSDAIASDMRLVDSRNISEIRHILHMDSRNQNLPSRTGFSKTYPTGNSRYNSFQRSDSMCNRAGSKKGQRSESQYDHLGMSTRSNVFPGLGNFQWNSTTAKTFTKKPFTPIEERNKFYGILTDDFGQWSAANVHHERMKKAWEEYLATAPKATANWKPPEPRAAPAQPPANPKPKMKKTPQKPKPQKIEKVVTPPPAPQEPPPGPPSKLPPSVPVDNNDDDFWDFYDNPFNKPT